MKNLLFLFAFLIITNSHAQDKLTVDDDGYEILLGIITKPDLEKNSFSVWFNSFYKSYDVDQETIDLFKKELIKDYKIVIFLGTWCGDSKRETPRLLKILDTANFPSSQLKIIAVGKSGDLYKKSPSGEEKGLNIIRVPTIIFYKNEKEINRIVETPVQTLEKDIAAIITTNEYKNTYIK